MTHLYPIYLNLQDKKCLIVGGGKVAERKAETLINYGAHVKVVSPHVKESIKIWQRQGKLAVLERVFRFEDLEEIFLVFIATNNAKLNKEVADLCRTKGIPVNAVDDPPNCDFYVPSVLRRKSLSLAISTEGKSPLFARRLREKLEKIITEDYGEFVDIMGELRPIIKNSSLSENERREVFLELLESDILALLEKGEKEKVKERIEKCMYFLQE